jgi:hypothetical protein
MPTPAPQARGELRASWATARQARSVLAELAEAPTAMTQAQTLRSLGGKPLIVVTAGSGQQAGWMAAQDDLVKLSANSLHRVVPNATYAWPRLHHALACRNATAPLALVHGPLQLSGLPEVLSVTVGEPG